MTAQEIKKNYEAREAEQVNREMDELLEVLRPAIRETTALGAAYLAGLATGVWKSREEISHLWSCNQLFEPKMDAAQREKLVKGWHKAVGRSQDWAEHEV